MEDYLLRDVKCPFYLERQGDRFRIKCEGPVKNTSVQLTFRGNKRRYFRSFCCGDYKRCRIYQMLQAKYESKKAEGD